MLVVHHTPIWMPLTAITGPTASLMREILSGGMNVYVMHTNFDRADEGVNDALCRTAWSFRLRAAVPWRGRHLHAPAPRKSPDGWAGTSGSGDHLLCHRLAVVAGSGFDPAIMTEAQRARGRCVPLGRDETLGCPGRPAPLYRINTLCARSTGHEAPCRTAGLAVSR